jgi:hypothetical protein
MAGSAGSGVRSADPRLVACPSRAGRSCGALAADDGHGGPARTPVVPVRTRVDDL